MKKNFLLLAVLPLVFLGCSKDDEPTNDIQVSNPIIETKSGNDVQINASSPLTITYVTESEFYASVSNSGLITANRIGETNILLSNSEKSTKVKVTILPQYTTYKDPYLKFGTSKDDVIAKAGTPSQTTTNGYLVYDNYSPSSTIAIYMFENSKLSGFGVTVKTSYASELGKFLRERYNQIGSEDNSIYYANSLNGNTATVAVVAEVTLNGINVVYAPTDNYTLRSSSGNEQIKHLMNEFKNQLKDK